jgi:hypothetical protein
MHSVTIKGGRTEVPVHSIANIARFTAPIPSWFAVFDNVRSTVASAFARGDDQRRRVAKTGGLAAWSASTMG